MVRWVDIRINVLDENKLFELDYNNHKVTNEFIGDARIVTIDNFFKNPDDVSDFIQTLP